MGCQIYTGNHGIYYSTGAWLAAHMTGIWCDYDNEINNHALTQADRFVPLTFEDFIEWATNRSVYYDPKITRRDFDTARQFIHDAARSGEHAHISY